MYLSNDKLIAVSCSVDKGRWCRCRDPVSRALSMEADFDPICNCMITFALNRYIVVTEMADGSSYSMKLI